MKKIEFRYIYGFPVARGDKILADIISGLRPYMAMANQARVVENGDFENRNNDVTCRSYELFPNTKVNIHYTRGRRINVSMVYNDSDEAEIEKIRLIFDNSKLVRKVVR